MRSLHCAVATAAIVALVNPPVARAGAELATLGVRCVVPPRVEAKVDYQAREIRIDASDIVRGYVDVRAASRLTVTTNSRAGYLIDFFTRLPIFRSVRVRTPAGVGVIGPDGGTIVERGRTGRALATEVTYRFVLDPRVRPGVYPWPLAIALRPL